MFNKHHRTEDGFCFSTVCFPGAACTMWVLNRLCVKFEFQHQHPPPSRRRTFHQNHHFWSAVRGANGCGASEDAVHLSSPFQLQGLVVINVKMLYIFFIFSNYVDFFLNFLILMFIAGNWPPGGLVGEVICMCVFHQWSWRFLQHGLVLWYFHEPGSGVCVWGEVMWCTQKKPNK